MKFFKRKFLILFIIMIMFCSSLFITSFAESDYEKATIKQSITYETSYNQKLSLAKPRLRKSRTKSIINKKSYKTYKRNKIIRNRTYGRRGFRIFRSISRFFKLLIFLGICLIILLIVVRKSRRR